MRAAAYDSIKMTILKMKQGLEGRILRGFCIGDDIIADETHHIKPLSEGGAHDRNNLIALCKSCHSQIHVKRGDYWESAMGRGYRNLYR